MYETTDGRAFESYGAACTFATANNLEVFEVRPNGERCRRWYPAPQKSTKHQRMYRERLAAYEAYQRMVNDR